METGHLCDPNPEIDVANRPRVRVSRNLHSGDGDMIVKKKKNEKKKKENEPG